VIGNLWHDSRLMSLLAGLITLLALAMLTIAAIAWLIHRPIFDLKTMELKGETRDVNLIGFQTQVLPKLGGSFFSVDLRKVRTLVESQPWVRRAVVQRSWPSGLRVTIEVHKPLAFWGDALLVNTYGEVFSANLAEADEHGNLPRLGGPQGSELLVSRMYVDAARSLRDIGLVPTQVSLSDRYGWTFFTEQGVRIELGREQEDIGIEDKLARLKRIYHSLSTNLMQSVQVIDMRYPRGLAVRGERLPKAVLAAG
jgi:cell division protein FtsQ